ncbi:hypothetical protein GCM10022200_15930 [Microbacterium awajiense]|uniref:AAA+ ATPase domain-containing protein n=1 Tax=Microbacterium awajiense TaxID=415214 RepID=A0ABP7AJL8_9MICO
MTGARRPAIRTPDQRIRVFVSSTLRELAPERAAVRTAIERLRLAPVMFELGARPHPPRELYRSYLAQSDIFIGIYAESYGWVAPDETVSGLEDEYNLAPPGMPKLIYIKTLDHRDPRLDTLITRIRDDDTAAYLPFTTPDDLAEHVLSDLATLLAERFDAARAETVAEDQVRDLLARVPVAYTRIVGRDRLVDDVVGMLAASGSRVVTLVGPGGIGKSRLAIAVAERAAEHFPDGTVFVPLENVLEPELLLATIGYALGVRDGPGLPLEQRLARALAGRRMLILLDNFEQIVSAAPILVSLYTVAPDAVFLVTSRAVLRIRGEQVVEVPPLPTKDPDAPYSLQRAREAPAVALFVQRAAAANPRFSVTDTNLAAIVGICDALDGVPLALELAAARTRTLPPAEILRRLDHQLTLLVDASRDLPPRQRTLRSTIDWSTDLLDESARTMLRELAAFSPGFTLDSVERLSRLRRWDFDVFAAMESLVDSSLVSQAEVDGQIVFSLLVSVREHGLAALSSEGREQEVRDAHAEVYAQLTREQAPLLGGEGQAEAVTRLTLERSNLRAGVRQLVARGDAETAADIAWRLYIFWWVGGYLTEVATWMEELLGRTADSASDRVRAIVAFYVGWRDMWQPHSRQVAASLIDAAETFASQGDRLGVAMTLTVASVAEMNHSEPDVTVSTARLTEAARRFDAEGAGWGSCLALVALGRLALLGQRLHEASALFERAVDASQRSGERFAGTIALHHLGRMRLLEGRLDEAEDAYLHGMAGSEMLRHDEGLAYSLEGLCAVAAARGDAHHAGVLSGAATTIRQHTAVVDAPPFLYHAAFLERLRGDPATAALVDEGEAEGAELGAYEAAERAREHVLHAREQATRRAEMSGMTAPRAP